MAPTPHLAWTSSWQLNEGEPANQSNTTKTSEQGYSPATMETGTLSDVNKALFEGGTIRVGECMEHMQLRDAEKAREAVSQCRRGLEADEIGDFLKMLVNESADWTGLFHAWEIHHAASNHKVCQQLLLLVADLLKHPLGRASRLQQLSPSNPAREEAALIHSRIDGLARNVVRKRMKQVYGHLTSGHKGRANACLMLLTATNGRGKSLSSELVGTFDFTLSSLAKLASPPKQSGKQEREGGNNPEKRSTRAVFIDFVLSFLLVGDPLTTRSALQKRSLFTPVLQNLYTDSAEQVTRVLNALKDHVLPETAGVPARLQGALFGDLAIEQLINIAAFDDASDVSLMRPATLAYEVLVRLFSNPSHGVCPAPQPAAAKKTKDAAAQSRLVRALLKLKATDVQRHSDLLTAATQAQPNTAAAYLGVFPFSLEPRTSDRWYAAMSLLRKIVTSASQDEVSQAHDAASVKALLQRVVPPALPRAVLSRAIQHRSSSIKFVSLAVLSSILDSLHTLQRRLQAASVPILKELTDQGRLLLPDPQVLLALNTAIEKGNVNQTDVKTNDSIEELERNADEENEDEESVSTEELHLKLLEVLAGYQRCVPDALAACRFNPYKLLPENPALLPRGEQAALLNLLLAASEAATSADSVLRSAGAAPQILPLLRLMLGAASKELNDKAELLVHQTLLATGVFSSHLEVDTWLDLLPRWDANVELRAPFSLSGSVAAFLSDAVMTVSKNPYRYLERVQEALSARTLLEVPQQQSEIGMQWEASNDPNAFSNFGGTSGPEFGPLVVCCLEKCLKVLSAGGLTAKPDSLGLVKKTGIAQFTAAALRQLLLVQRDPEPLAVAVDSVLGELNEEASSCCEWAPLFSLQKFAQAFLSRPHRSSQPLQSNNDLHTSLGDLIAVFSSAKPSNRPQLSRALGYALVTLPPSEVAQKLPELTSAMTSSERAVLVELLKSDPSLLPTFAQSHPDMLQKALKRLGRGPEKLPPLTSLLLSLPFATVLSAVGSLSHSEFSLDTPGVNSLLQRLLTSNQRATAVRMLLHLLSAESRSSKIDVLFALLRQAVFTPEPASFSLADADVMVDALQHPALANNFLSQHHVSELDKSIAQFVRDALSAVPLGRGSEGLNRQVERACSQYVKQTVELLERRLPDDDLGGELDAVLMLVPFDDTPSLLRLLDRLLPKPSAALSQTPRAKVLLSESPTLQTLALQLASKIFSSDLNTPLERTEGESTARAEAIGQQTALTHAELHEQIAALARLNGSEEVDACLLGALQNADRTAYEAACQAIGLSSERQPLPHDEANSILQLNPEKKLKVSSSELAKITPIELVKKYVEERTKTRAEVLIFLVRQSLRHRLEFGRQLRERLSVLTVEQKVILAPPVEVFLAAAKETDAEHLNEGTLQEDAKSIAEAYRNLVTRFLCEQENEPGLRAGSTEKTISEGKGVMSNGLSSEEPVSNGKKRKRRAGIDDQVEEGGMREAQSRETSDRPSKKSKQTEEQNGQTEGSHHKGQNGAESDETRSIRETFKGFPRAELFSLCSVWAPLSGTERKRLLKKLLPKEGWGLQQCFESRRAAEKEGIFEKTKAQLMTNRVSSEDRISAAHVLQQAAVARILVLKKGADSADASKLEEVDAKDLVKYAQTLMTSLASLHLKTAEAKSSGETKEVRAGLERGLLILLDEVAGLLGGSDLTSKQLAAITTFASSVIQCRTAGASSLRVARVVVISVEKSVSRKVELNKQFKSQSDHQETVDEHTASIEIGDLQSEDTAQEVARIGSRLFEEALSSFMPTLLASKLGAKPLPEAMGKHSGDFVPSSLSSILSLLDTPAPPKMQSRIETEGDSSEAGSIDTCLSASIRSLLSPPEKLQSAEDEGFTSPSKGHQKLGLEARSGSEAAVKQKEAENVMLESVRLLSTLLDLRILKFQSETLSTDELLSTLLGAYGATMSDLDRQMLHLMRQIGGQGGVGALGLAGMDYLWGERALQSRQERKETGLPLDPGARARLFREESPLDPRRCGLTVLYFPVRRGVQPRQPDEGVRKRSDDPEEDLKAAAYDPSFLLPYAVHVLKTGAMEARDFARSGLLQVALASLAAADEGMRKAGYSVLALYMNLLEDSATSFREKQQVRLLLHYVRNAVTQPLQRIPMTSAVFAAEACCIQMHPEHQLYAAINKFILKRPALDLEDIPLFYNLFNSGSPTYRTERVWMLRLLAAGLVTSADGRVFRRRFVLELLMSFAGSAMADAFTRRLVMQVFRRAVQVQKCASDLVDHAGLVPWLANLVLLENDAGVLAGMALECLEVLLTSASDDWSRDATFDDFLAAVKSIHQKLAASEKTPVTAAITVPFLRLATKLAEWSGRRKRSLGPIFSSRELSPLFSYASAHHSLDAVQWALQLLVHLPLNPQNHEQELRHVIDWGSMAAVVLLQAEQKEAFSSLAKTWAEKVKSELPSFAEDPL